MRDGQNGMDEFRFIDRSDSNAEKYTLRQKLFHTQEVQPMWVADMDIATPECVIHAVQKRLHHPILGYEIMPNSAYEAQIGWMREHHGFEIKREWLSYSPSVVASIGCAIRAFSEEGDEVIVMDPVYPPFYSMVKDNNRSLLLHPLKQDSAGIYRFDIERLRAQITPKTKLLLLCSPHNPIGRVWSRDELLALGILCLEHGIRIISDEIHSDIVFTPHKHIPMASLSDELLNNTLTLIGPGKTFNMAGFSISTVCITDETMRKRYEEEAHRVHLGDGAVLSHVAFETAYAEGRAWHQKLLEHLMANASLIEAWGLEHPVIKFRSPEATYLAWLDCRALGFGDRELREFFVHKAGLGLSPGLSFGKEGSGFMRLNFAVPTSVLGDALDRLGKALND
ncbi:MAG: pyridoxal phosphate-dependent aminotransferase [Sulfuricurvum sp.]|uniref:pyridoxal phosphate-dependent aminotransferase n=1 Tax=Sulfuricurvum sp. TaxID=2025608 RepID=UPI0026187BB3|nr:pyridoxal phosphate-dependent aminotransferase [Sulfuricurvum sp.]MDD5160421.1 pyridoxal phosphate-dependent aminotransferase [Sulfuricurvum sp.]